LKEYLKDADFFSIDKNPPLEYNPHFYEGEPNDWTLILISFFIQSLHTYSHPAYQYFQPLDDELITWFVAEYKKRIDEYIMVTRLIDNTVRQSKRAINGLAANSKEYAGRYGHHAIFDKPFGRQGNDLKAYYEERLGITDLKVVPPYIE
jgi:hypothetical protein